MRRFNNFASSRRNVRYVLNKRLFYHDVSYFNDDEINVIDSLHFIIWAKKSIFYCEYNFVYVLYMQKNRADINYDSTEL